MAYPGPEEVVSMDAETRVVRDSNGKLVPATGATRAARRTTSGSSATRVEQWERVFKPGLAQHGIAERPERSAREYQPRAQRGHGVIWPGLKALRRRGH